MLPIVIALDRTLTAADTRLEAAFARLKALPHTLRQRLSGAASAPNGGTPPSATHLPYHLELVDWLRQQQAEGRRICLTTTGDRGFAEAVARHLGCVDEVIAFDGAASTAARLEQLRVRFRDGFAYASGVAADLPILEQAAAAILVGDRGRMARGLAGKVPTERTFSVARAGAGLWIRALRVHQWMKNLLLFVPLLTAFAFTDLHKVVAAIVGFFAFCLTASATYLVNDLWDINSDRAHSRKKTRAFASAQISLPTGLTIAGLLLVTALAVAQWLLPPLFTVALVAYLTLTSLYSWTLKTYVLIDVLTLALLFTLRIIAGSLAVDVAVSSWLFVFSVFIFFSLAMVKRCAELVHLQQLGQQSTRGRDYNVSDLQILWPLGVGASLSAVVIFSLYINAMTEERRYGTPELLWLVGVGLIYWLGRLWIKTGRGRMHDDPLVFAVRDRGSRITIFCMVLAAVAAHFLR